MGLKDEILAQRQREAEQAKLAEQTQKRGLELKFAEIKENFEKGVVPKEWEEIYDKFATRIREWFANESGSFCYREDVSEEYYQSKIDCGDGTANELSLMNDYLTERLQKDGFEHARFELVEDTELYFTSEDNIRRQEKQAEADRLSNEKYREALWNEVSKDAGGDLSRVAAPRINIVSVDPTGTRKIYYFIVECRLDIEEDKPSEQKKPAAKKHIRWDWSEVFTVAGVCAGIGVVVSVILVFTVRINEMFIPILGVCGFVYGFILGMLLKYIIEIVALNRLSRENGVKYVLRKEMKTAIALTVLFFVLLVAAIVGGVFLAPYIF